ncbi:hypothetical protein [uncultured Halopseudomonas sp.]|uniref:hypothetical protein n=1 Tax=uncultured Halopseudomonas sp. TaxID=2901193 RepID=UPI0030EE2130|tara:strand:+ start:16612 stop:16881 length:270 start_codon:yes stop_codon:yes gene_type:complete
MKFQNILYTTALSIAIAAGSGAAFAADHSAAEHEMEKDTSMNNNDVESMREEASDEVLPNDSNRAVPGAPNAGKNPDIDPVAGETDFVD